MLLIGSNFSLPRTLEFLLAKTSDISSFYLMLVALVTTDSGAMGDGDWPLSRASTFTMGLTHMASLPDVPAVIW
jgi:hypothetical protein